MCNLCGKTYLSSPALYLHMKIKHQEDMDKKEKNDQAQQVGPNGQLRPKARGRPRKYGGDYEQTTHSGQCLDPTGEMFLRAEGRTGGPLDPYT